jgi:hypothetical protein
MSFVYTPAKTSLLNGSFPYTTAADLRVILVMTNTTAGNAQSQDCATIAAIKAVVSPPANLDEFTGAGYSPNTGGQPMTGENVLEDATLNLAKFVASPTTFATIGGSGSAPRSLQAAIIIRWNASQDASQPIAYIDTGGFPIATNGGDVTLQWNAAGVIQAA